MSSYEINRGPTMSKQLDEVNMLQGLQFFITFMMHACGVG